MPGTEEVATQTFPVSKPYISEFVRRTIQLPSRVFGRLKQSERKPINDKGYMWSLLTRSNPNIGGGMNSGDVMLTGGSDSYIQLVVGSVVWNGARQWGGGAIRQQQDAQYFGLTRNDQDVLDADRFATECNKSLCFAGLTNHRGITSAAASYDAGTNLSTLTFAAANGGSYFLKEMEGRSFLVHAPTTPFALHGGATPFPLFDVPTPTTARFTGDMTGGTAIASGDLVVPVGTGDNVSGLNKGIRNLLYMTPVTGDYFTADVDTQDKIRATQHDVTGNDVTRAILEYMDGLFTFRFPGVAVGTKNHTDLMSPTQYIRMLFEAEGPLRINTQDGSVAYNPKTTWVGWNGRKHEQDVHILDTTWFIFDMPDAYYLEQRAWGVWDYDGQEVRSIPASSSRRDALQKHYLCVHQTCHEEPRLNMCILNCSTTGAPLKTSSGI